MQVPTTRGSNGTSSFMADSSSRVTSPQEQLHGRLAQEFNDAINAFAVQFAADLPVEAFGSAMDRDEADELLEPGQRLLGVPHQPQVQLKAAVAAGTRPGATVEVVDDDRRVAADQVRIVLEDRRRLLGRELVEAVVHLIGEQPWQMVSHDLGDRLVPAGVDQEDV